MKQISFGLLLLAAVGTATVASADEPKFDLPGNLGKSGLGLSGFGSGKIGSTASHVKLSASVSISKDAVSGQPSKGELVVKAEIDPGWHIYSLTQKNGGSAPSKLEVTESPNFRIVGSFTATPKPKVIPPGGNNPFDVELEEHVKSVVWTVPIEFSPGVDPKTTDVQVRYSGQVCQDSGVCIPIRWTPVAVAYLDTEQPVTQQVVNQAAPQDARVAGEVEYRAAKTHVTLKGSISPAIAKPGGKVKVSFTATPEAPYHVYALEATDPKVISKPTLIAFDLLDFLILGSPVASPTPTTKQTGIPEQPIANIHSSTVTWSTEFKVPESMSLGPQVLSGLVGYQSCTNSTCDSPSGAAFRGAISIGAEEVSGTVPLEFTRSSYTQAAKLALANFETAQRTATNIASNNSTSLSANELSGKPLYFILGAAFLGGLILNVMPCVLPVIGLKIMSFVQQAGESRFRIFYLNLWFSLGLLCVFWVLASVAVGFSLLGMGTFGWAKQFQYAGFNIGLAAIVFVFALSFMGVWEIPIPGFVGGSVANQMAAREGAFGAFCKGVLATVLATPCTGPLMGPAISWAVVQPPLFTYLAFTFLGLGMASPFLLIGLFPALVRLVPRPGQWMVTFKQFMGFVLMGTVVWLFYALDKTKIVQSLIFLLGLGISCWLIGMIDITASFSEKVRGWSKAIAVGGFAWFLAFGLLFSTTNQLPWMAFERLTLDQYLAEGRAVLVDFTGDS